ncbi:MAG: hypothetical protein ACYTF0_08545 [Planctomycetota bacterium]|jgi:hypothetical protein
MTQRGTPVEAQLAGAISALLTHLALVKWAPIPLLANLGVTAAVAGGVFYGVRHWYYRGAS